jgi:hypothetical protein
MAKGPPAKPIPSLPPMKAMRPGPSDVANPTAAPWSMTTGTSMREKALEAASKDARIAQGVPGSPGGLAPQGQIGQNLLNTK